MLNRTAIAISGALLVVACSCSSGSSTAQPPTTAKRRPPTTRPSKVTTIPKTPTTSAVTTPPPTPLADLILSTGPSGFEQQADDVADTGPTNLAKAADDDNSDTARQALLSSGFEAGYQRQWTSVDASGNTTNADFVFLYRFATPEGAQAYAQHWRLALLNTNQRSPVQSFSPPFIPNANGLSIADKQGSIGVVLFAKGQYAVQVLVNGAPSIDQSGAASVMAFAQYQRLP